MVDDLLPQPNQSECHDPLQLEAASGALPTVNMDGLRKLANRSKNKRPKNKSSEKDKSSENRNEVDAKAIKAIEDHVKSMQGIKVHDSQLEDESKHFLVTKEHGKIIQLKPDFKYEGPLKDLPKYDQSDDPPDGWEMRDPFLVKVQRRLHMFI